MAKTMRIVLLMVAAGLTALAGRSLSAPPSPSVPSDIVYGGPGVLRDPADPLQSVRWTLGLTVPPRLRLNLGRFAPLEWTEYDAERNLVLVSYRAGSEEILPSYVFPVGEFVAYRLARDLRRDWIRRTRNTLTEDKARPTAQRGLVDLSLPFQLPFTERLFGEGAPNLKVSGSEQITIGGTSSWVVGQVTGERGGGSLFPKLDMRQRLNVNLQGTIGSKLFINVAQNSEALTPLENSIKIRYRGDEDEVLKNLELGNTNLSLPATQFVSFSTRQEGLFGVKGEGQVGPIDFTAIASRQQGESGLATLQGGAQVQTSRVEDYRFIPRKYFFLSDPDSLPIPRITVGTVRVYLDDRDENNNAALGAQDAQAWLNPENPDTSQWLPQGAPYRGWFHLLTEEEDYRVYNNENFTQPILILRNSLSTNQALAVSYVWPGRGIQDSVGGMFHVVKALQAARVDTLRQLKLILPTQDTWKADILTQSPWAAARRLEMKNAYNLGGRNLAPETFELKVVRDVGGSNPSDLVNAFGVRTPLIRLLGLDQKNNTNVTDFTPDGKIDPEFIDYAEGVLFFPDLRPFDPSAVDIEGSSLPGRRGRSWPVAAIPRPDTLGWQLEGGRAYPSPALVRDQEVVPEIYDLRSDVLSREADRHHLYTIETSFRTSVNTIQLNALGTILEGSETLRLNGEVLQRGEDYTIFYDTGTITLKNPQATAPGADLVVTYGFDTPLTRGARSLMGISLSKREDGNSKLGFSTSWLYDSRQLPDRRPRLGEEPTRTVVGDFSGKLRLRPWLLTQITNKIPLVNTSAPSQFEVSGAMGLSLPNPNTRGEVYIDDMEGTEVITSAGMNRFNWSYSSVPARAVGSGGEEATPAAIDRGQMLWFSPNTVRVADLNPGEDNKNQRNDIVSVLETLYIPQVAKSWGGLVTPLSSTGADVTDAQYIDVWVNDYRGWLRRDERRGEILLDLGSVSEDAVWDPRTPPDPPNSRLDYEDVNRSGGQVEKDEDVGLDGKLNNAETLEEGRRGPPGWPSDALSSNDPAGDDYISNDIQTNLSEKTTAQRVYKYQRLNGTENDREADTESLNGDYQLQTDNDYLEYRIDLSAPAFIDNGRDSSVTEPDKGWRLYRIPLDDVFLKVGQPTLSTVKHLRMWFRGIDPGDTLDLQVASVEIVGNRWEVENRPTLDPGETFAVAVVNNKENGDYSPPFRTERINAVEEREQSLSLDFENLAPGRDIRASRTLVSVRDYTLYQDVGFYVNPRLESPADSVEFYLRFGSEGATDTLSYYEVATVLTTTDPRRMANGWFDLHFDVADLSRIKIGAPPGTRSDQFLAGPADLPDSLGGPRPTVGEGLKVTVRGVPSLSRVRRVSAGVRNVTSRVVPRGRIWVDELRMGAVRRDVGMASRAALNLVLGDLASLSGSINQTSADFLRLGEVRGSGTSNLSYNASGLMNLNKFVEGLRIDAPLRVNYRRGKRVPKFFTNSDILYEGADSGRDVSEEVLKDVSLSLNRSPRGRSPWWARYTIDPVRLNGRWSQSVGVGTTQVDTTRQVGGSAGWSLNLNGVTPLRLFRKLEVWPWPRSIQIDLARGTSDHQAWSRSEVNPDSLIRTVNTTNRVGTVQFNAGVSPIRLVTYGFRSSRDLIDEHFGADTTITRLQNPPRDVFGLNLGREVNQSHTLALSYSPPVLKTLLPRLNWNSGGEVDRSPSLTRADWDSTVISVGNSNTATASLTVPLGDMLQGLLGGGGTRGYPGANPARPPAAPDTSRKGGGGGAKGELRNLFTNVIGFRAIQGSASFGKRSGITGVHGSPTFAYLLGFTREPGLGDNLLPVEGASFNRTLTENSSFRGSTSIAFFRQITIDLNYQKRKDHARTNSSVGRVTDDTTWPEVRVNWGDVQRKIPLVKKLFPDFRAVSTSYSRTTRTTGTDDEPKESVSTTTNWQPLVGLQGTIRGGWRTNFNLNRSSTLSSTRREGGAESFSDRSTFGLTLSLGKQIGAGKGKREVDLDMQFGYNKSTSSTRIASGIIPPQVQSTDDLTATSNARLRFTRTISGTFGLNFRQQRNIEADWTRRSVGLTFTTGFNF